EQANKPGAFTALTKEQKEAGKEAEAAAKKLQSAYETVEQSYRRQIALINTEVDKRKDATEVAKLQFEIESGKLAGINAEQQKRLNGLAEELDRLQKLKKAKEDDAKAAAFGAALDQESSTAAAGFDIELAGAGAGDKYRARLQGLLDIRQRFNEKLSDLTSQLNSGDIGQSLYDQET
ncbi:TPA: phage tail tape measure protein, partial [Pseudomonas aeruginosa]|nr:phage tail tape measure protein [Pseudomonas aeruginosa]